MAPELALVGALSATAIYYVVLGILVRRLGKSPITWIGLSILTSPFGLVISCFFIWRDTQAACKELLHPRKEVNRVAEEGDLAYRAGTSKLANPYRFPNASEEHPRFAEYWDRGYSVAERRIPAT
jgi:hypothetical protein